MNYEDADYIADAMRDLKKDLFVLKSCLVIDKVTKDFSNVERCMEIMFVKIARLEMEGRDRMKELEVGNIDDDKPFDTWQSRILGGF